MSEKIISKISEILDVDADKISNVERLLGGMSNLMFSFDFEGETYTFRVPGKNANVFVDRDIEFENIKRIGKLDLNNETIYFDTVDGYKIAKYVDGETLTSLGVADYYEQAAKMLKKLHTSDVKAVNDYAPLDRLTKYEALVVAEGFNEKRDRYIELKKKFISYSELLDNDELVICHGDSQTNNFIVTENKELKLLDWEFTGNNHPFYDIACFGNTDFTHAVNLLPIYLERTPTNEEYKKLYLLRMFQCLQWHNVALYKHLIGLSEELKVDFLFFSNLYLDKAQGFLEDALKY